MPTPELKAELLRRFPWLGDEDAEANGGDTVDALVAWYASLPDKPVPDGYMLRALESVYALIEKHGIGDSDAESEPVVRQVQSAIRKAKGTRRANG
jgi:hypothetical protein